MVAAKTALPTLVTRIALASAGVRVHWIQASLYMYLREICRPSSYTICLLETMVIRKNVNAQLVTV
jgi:hypothetical protein